MFGIDLEKEVGDIFKDIIEKYHFVMVPFDADGVFLAKKNFGVMLFISRDGLTPVYYTKNSKGEYLEYWFGMFIGREFDDTDRSIIKDDDLSTLQNEFKARLKITASGLQRHWSNILEGDKSWIQDYLNQGYDEGTLNAPTLAFVKKYF